MNRNKMFAGFIVVFIPTAFGERVIEQWNPNIDPNKVELNDGAGGVLSPQA